MSARPSHHTRQLKHQDLSKSKSKPITVKQETAVTIIKLSASPSPDLGNGHGWEHPNELPILDATNWSQGQIMKELITTAFFVPGRTARPRAYFVEIICADGSSTVVPQAYRVPLMFVCHFLWESIRLVLRTGEWEQFKIGILHVGRILRRFTEQARAEMEDSGVARAWRCPEMDRLLVRYRLGWLISDHNHLKEFWEMYGEAEYRKDPVKKAGTNWEKEALKGHKGFMLTEEQLDNGYPIRDLMQSVEEKDGVWVSGDGKGATAYAYFEAFRATGKWEKIVPAPESEKPKLTLKLTVKVNGAEKKKAKTKDGIGMEKGEVPEKPKPSPQKEKVKVSSAKRKVEGKPKQPMTAPPFPPTSFRPAVFTNSLPPPAPPPTPTPTPMSKNPYAGYSTFQLPPLTSTSTSMPRSMISSSTTYPISTPRGGHAYTSGATPYGSALSYPTMKSSLPTILEAIEVFKTQNSRIALLEKELGELRCVVRAREMEGIGVGWATGARVGASANSEDGWRNRRAVSHLLEEDTGMYVDEDVAATPIRSRRKLERMGSSTGSVQ